VSALDWAHSIDAVADVAGLAAASVAIDGYSGVNEAAEIRELEAWERQLQSTYRVLDLNSRKTVATGLPFGAAHRFIERAKAANPQARFDLRTEL
jgi:hypothetical protein